MSLLPNDEEWKPRDGSAGWSREIETALTLTKNIGVIAIEKAYV
jgi:hypothetical protein